MIKMLCLVCVLYVVLCGGASGQMLTGSSNPLRDIAEKGTSLRKLDDCFCEVGDVAVLMNINRVVCSAHCKSCLVQWMCVAVTWRL